MAGKFHQKLKWFHFIPVIGQVTYGVQNFNKGRAIKQSNYQRQQAQSQVDLLRAYQQAAPEIAAQQEREAELKKEAQQATQDNIKMIVAGIVSIVIIAIAAYLIFKKK